MCNRSVSKGRSGVSVRRRSIGSRKRLSSLERARAFSTATAAATRQEQPSPPIDAVHARARARASRGMRHVRGIAVGRRVFSARERARLRKTDHHHHQHNRTLSTSFSHVSGVTSSTARTHTLVVRRAGMARRAEAPRLLLAERVERADSMMCVASRIDACDACAGSRRDRPGREGCRNWVGGIGVLCVRICGQFLGVKSPPLKAPTRRARRRRRRRRPGMTRRSLTHCFRAFFLEHTLVYTHAHAIDTDTDDANTRTHT